LEAAGGILRAADDREEHAMRIVSLMIVIIPTIVMAAPADYSSKSAAGRDGGYNHSGRLEGAARSPRPKPQSISRPAPNNGVTDADLLENERRANDPDYVPDPNDPDSCAAGCAVPDPVPGT
jgi:hypothetical protein